MKFAIGIFLVSQVFVLSALAEDACNKSHDCKGMRDDLTIAGGVETVAGAGYAGFKHDISTIYTEYPSSQIFAAKKYHNGEIEDVNPKSLINNETTKIAEGDRVTVTYIIPKQDQAKYIKGLNDKFNDIEKQRSQVDSSIKQDGATESLLRKRNILREESSQLFEEIQTAKRGVGIPKNELKMVVDSPKNTRVETNLALINLEDKGAKIISVRRLTGDNLRAFRSTIRGRNIGLGAVVLGLGFIAEERLTGVFSKKLTIDDTNPKYSPLKQSYEDQQKDSRH